MWWFQNSISILNLLLFLCFSPSLPFFLQNSSFHFMFGFDCKPCLHNKKPTSCFNSYQIKPEWSCNDNWRACVVKECINMCHSQGCRWQYWKGPKNHSWLPLKLLLEQPKGRLEWHVQGKIKYVTKIGTEPNLWAQLQNQRAIKLLSFPSPSQTARIC